MTRKSIVEYAALIGGALAVYPLAKSGGILDNWLGAWWLFVIPAIVTAVALYSSGKSRQLRRDGGA